MERKKVGWGRPAPNLADLSKGREATQETKRAQGGRVRTSGETNEKKIKRKELTLTGLITVEEAWEGTP